MKQANNNEVDLLLRSLARERKDAARQSGSKSGDAERVSSDHLDVDELNSYAEGVAPAPARARYTEHLADCDACRGIVVGLIQASGAAGRLAAPEPQGGTTFWQKLSSLFSPPVLRYAVPALVLTAVIGIGLLALKQQRGSELVAQNETPTNAPNSNPGAGGPQGTIGAATKPTPALPGISGAAPSPPNADSDRDKLISPAEKPRVVSEVPPDVSVSKAGAAKDSDQPADTASVAQSRPYAQEPKSAAAPPPAPVLDAEKANELAKEQSVKREDQTRDEDDAFRTQSDGVHGPNRSRNNNVQSENSRRGVANVAGGRGPSGMDKKKAAEEEETRTVLGRHFSREGNAWVDTAYDSSRATVRVARGSDQFRALIADEPGIRTISEQLNGVVIVVWKGRAYRIQ